MANEKLNLEYENRELKNKLAESEDRMKVLATEINRLGDLLEAKSKGQADTIKILQEEAQKSVDLANHKVNLENEIKNLRNQIGDLQHQNSILGNENYQLSQYAKDKQQIENENDKLREKVTDLIRENNNLNAKLINAQQLEAQAKMNQNQIRENENLIQ